MNDDQLAIALNGLYKHHGIPSSLFDVENEIACNSNVLLYMQDIGLTVTGDTLIVTTIDSDTKWIKKKLILLREFLND